MSHKALTLNPALLDAYFATPAIWVPGMDDLEWQYELDRMLMRSQLTHDFVDGVISPGDYMDGLDDLGINVNAAAKDWEEGVVYLQ